MVSLPLSIICVAFISLGLPDFLLGVMAAAHEALVKTCGK